MIDAKYSAIFLNGAFPEEHLEFYREAIDHALYQGFVVAVDGALSLFDKLQRCPNLLLGDFDSVSPETLARFPDLNRVQYPREKDTTDGELAVRYLLEQGCDHIEIFGAIDTRFETDQMLANIFLLTLPGRIGTNNKTKIRINLTDHRQHIYLIEDSSLEIEGSAGDLLSIVPVSQKARLTTTGTKWVLNHQETFLGSSWTLRNSFADSVVTIIVEGKAIIVHRHTE